MSKMLLVQKSMKSLLVKGILGSELLWDITIKYILFSFADKFQAHDMMGMGTVTISYRQV